MRTLVAALRWDVVLQARNGFYWASAFVVLMVGGLLLAVPQAARANDAVWVPAILAVNLQITTFFFMAGLMLLERDEGTLTALAVSPLTPSGYLATRDDHPDDTGGGRNNRARPDRLRSWSFVVARPRRNVGARRDLYGPRRGNGDELRIHQRLVCCRRPLWWRSCSRRCSRMLGSRRAGSFFCIPSNRPDLDPSGHTFLRALERLVFGVRRLPRLECGRVSVGTASRDPADARHAGQRWTMSASSSGRWSMPMHALVWRDPLLKWVLVLPIGLALLLRVLIPKAHDGAARVGRIRRGTVLPARDGWLSHDRSGHRRDGRRLSVARRARCAHPDGPACDPAVDAAISRVPRDRALARRDGVDAPGLSS